METQTSDTVLASKQTGHVVTLTLNRPQARNSLSLELLRQLKAAVVSCSEDPSVHVLTLAANGPAFCAGHDLKELTAARAEADGGAAFFDQTMSACAEVMMAIIRCPKPVIASVHATATAAGCQLVATCDLALAADTAKFATPGVNIGLFCSTPMVALSRNVGRKQSMKMLLTGDLIDAEEARSIGLINDLVPPEELTKATQKLAQQIAAKSPVTVKIGKEAFYRQIEMALPDAYEFTREVMVANMLQADAEEGIKAFLEKRPPEWSKSGRSDAD